MEFQEYVIQHIERLSNCSCRSLSQEGEIVFSSPEPFRTKDPVRCCKELFSRLTETVKTAACNIYTDEDFFYGIFFYSERFYVLGPVSGGNLPEPRIRQYLSRCGSDKDFPVPYLPIDYFEELLAFFYGLITNDLSNSVNVLLDRQHTQIFDRQIKQKYAVYHLSNSEELRPHMAYSRERELAENAANGKIELPDSEIWQPGIIAKGKLKQCEYECVCAITITTRTAIQAGVAESRAYELSDLLLQRLSVARDMIEMKQIYKYSMELFSDEIEKAKKDCSENMYIEKAKNYIAKHIYEKIRLDDIAKHIGLNSSYLSGIFTQETGRTLSRYILEKKIELSCNLLRYSDSSIAGIAEYMQITPQNYFTKVFREIMGTTPAKYRKQNKLHEFKSEFPDM